MLVGYEANNALRNGRELGDYGRELVTQLASGHIGDYRAMLFTKRVRRAYRTFFTSCSNVSTYVPSGFSRLVPSVWLRFMLNPCLKSEKIKIFHGLNSELPYGIGRDVKTLITYYGMKAHHKNSMVDMLVWKWRVRYAFKASDIIVATSGDARHELLSFGVPEKKIRLVEGLSPLEISDQEAAQYFDIYAELLGEK